MGEESCLLIFCGSKTNTTKLRRRSLQVVVKEQENCPVAAMKSASGEESVKGDIGQRQVKGGERSRRDKRDGVRQRREI